MTPFLQGRRILPIFISGAWGLLLTGSAVASIVPPSSSAPPKVRVLLQRNLTSLQVAGWDLQLREEGQGPRASSTDRVRAGRQSLKIRCERGSLRVTGPTIRERRYRRPLRLESPSGTLTWSSRLVREGLVLKPGRGGCLVINELDIEKYLDGVVNGEFSARWNAEAVAAQVIAARSYAWHQMQEARRKGVSYDVESTTRDQVYLGTAGEEPRASRLVAATRGLVLVAGGSIGAPRPIKAFYHSTCGGSTDDPQTVWGRAEPGVRGGVRCQHCGSSPRYRWSHRVSESEMNQALKSLGPEKVLAVEVLSRFPSGRVRRLKVAFSDASGKMVTQDIPGARFRSLIGSEQLRSTAFEVTRGPGTDWLFEGRGFGHGVGMCQWGAKEMGAAGYKSTQILSTYYPEATIRRAWR